MHRDLGLGLGLPEILRRGGGAGAIRPRRGGPEHRLIGGPHRDVGIALGQVETLIRYHDVQDDLRIDAAKSDEYRAQEMPEEDVAGGDPQFPEGRRSWPVTLRSKPTIS